MIELGVSSACYYPVETERALEKIINNGFPACEIFFNSPSETAPAFIDSLYADAQRAGVRIKSFHPYMSFAESFFLFSSYMRRFSDMLPLYEELFAAAKALGAGIFIFHGMRVPGSIPETEYFRRFAALTEIGKRYDLRICQENVVAYRSEDPQFLKRMAAAVGKDFGVVLDIKQARRAGYDYHEYLDAVGGYIRHIHVSDFNETKDCLPPGEGLFDFHRLFHELNDVGYSGACIIELYRDSYRDEAQIGRSYDYLKNLLP